MDRGLREQSFACTASDRLICLRSRDVSSTASKTLQTSVIAFSVYFRSEAPLLIDTTSIGAMHRMGVETSSSVILMICALFLMSRRQMEKIPMSLYTAVKNMAIFYIQKKHQPLQTVKCWLFAKFFWKAVHLEKTSLSLCLESL